MSAFGGWQVSERSALQIQWAADVHICPVHTLLQSGRSGPCGPDVLCFFLRFSVRRTSLLTYEIYFNSIIFFASTKSAACRR